MAIPTSATSVALIDRLYNNGEGIVLHPETELKVVSMTTDQYISRSVNSMYLDTAKLWTSAIGPDVADSYCPLSAVVDGATQYADMYVAGGTAVITQLPGSTGYGTLVVPITTATSIRPVATATNGRVPTELAAAVALAGKENTLVGGSCITLSRDAANTTVNVNAVTSIGAVPTDTNVPTEAAVKAALNSLEDIASAYADNAEGRANTYTDNKAVTVENWVDTHYLTKTDAAATYISLSTARENFVSKTDSATVNSLGIVKLHNEVTGQTNYPYLLPTEAAMKDYVDQHGGNGKPVSSATNGAVYVEELTASYTVSAQVQAPVHISDGRICVSSATNTSLGVVYVPTDSGLALNNGELKLASATANTIGGVIVGSGLSADGTGKLDVTPATTTSLGGVFVPAHKGLSIGNNGSITLDRAPIVSTYEQVYAAERAASSGGVILTDSMVYPTINPSVLTPSVRAVVRAYGSNTQFAIYSSSLQNSVSSGAIYYASGNVYTSNAVYIGKLGPASLIVGSGSASRYAYVHIQSANNAWIATMASGTTMPNDSENNYYVPIASAEWGLDASNQQYVSSYQLHTGPIIVGKDTRTGGGGGGGQTTITKKSNNYGVSLAGDAATGYTIGFDYASPLSANTDNNEIGVSKATTGAFGVVKIKEGGGIGVNGGTIYTTSDTYQGPFKVTSTGAATKDVEGVTINGYSVAITGGYVYELDDAQTIGGGTAAIFPGDTLYLYGSSGATVAAYHTHADYSYTTNGAAGWAGEMAIPIASNNDGAIVQLQYGHIQREHWGDDYREEFNISRIGPIGGMNYDPEAAAGATGSYLPYKFIIKNGGKVLGLPDTIPAADALLDSTYIAYPTVAVSGTNKTDALYLKVVNGGVSGGATYDGASRVPIWMNIWHGKWVTGIGGHDITRGGTTITPTTSAWRYVVDTRCYETANLTSVTNAYSVQIGYVTMNGAPIQIHKGAIEVRGRWT